MADDTRDSSRTTMREPPPGATSPPDHITSNSPKIYESFSRPPPSANALPEGSGQNTAGSRPQEFAITDAIKTVKLSDFKDVVTYPCAREALLFGIGSGFGVGGVRFLFGGPIMKACNWAVGTFVFGALANYELCLQAKKLEKAHMAKAVEIMDKKKAEKEAALDAKRAERRRLKEEQDKMTEEAAKKSSWKFW